MLQIHTNVFKCAAFFLSTLHHQPLTSHIILYVTSMPSTYPPSEWSKGRYGLHNAETKLHMTDTLLQEKQNQSAGIELAWDVKNTMANQQVTIQNICNSMRKSTLVHQNILLPTNTYQIFSFVLPECQYLIRKSICADRSLPPDFCQITRKEDVRTKINTNKVISLMPRWLQKHVWGSVWHLKL